MSVDLATVKRVAHLARIAVTDEEAARMEGELNTILGFRRAPVRSRCRRRRADDLGHPMAMKKRADVVTDGSKADDIVANAPETTDNFFMVPKVVE
jgi:aspartyl-tRNA(Asn)/glutamyl-tRNA(Gln) amidotransferase subunit C